MPRKPLLMTNEHPYHVRGRSNNKDWFELDLENCFGAFSEVLEVTVERYKFQLHSFLLMSNHFHMMLSTPNSNLSAGMRFFMTESGRRLRHGSNRINHTFGGRYKGNLITSEFYYLRCFKYVYRNPVRAGVASDVLEYPYSSLVNSRLQKIISPPERGHDDLIPTDKEKLIEWLNTPTPKDLEHRIKAGLRKNQFELGVDRKTRMPVGSLIDLPL